MRRGTPWQRLASGRPHQPVPEAALESVASKGQSPETGPGLVSVDRSARSTDGEQVVLDAVYLWVPSLHPRSDFSQEPGR